MTNYKLKPEKDIKYVLVSTVNGPLYGSTVFEDFPCYYVLGESCTTYPSLELLSECGALDTDEDIQALRDGEIKIYQLKEVKHREWIADILQHRRDEAITKADGRHLIKQEKYDNL